MREPKRAARRARAGAGFAIAISISCAFAPARAVELNTATQAELESIRGIGVAMSSAILVERGQRPFADWPDFARRIRGAGGAGGASGRPALSGLTVNGLPHPGATAAAVGAPAVAASAP